MSRFSSQVPAAVRRDRPSRDRLVLAHLTLVRSVASRFADRGESANDLRQAGYVGLLKAAERFDADRGVTFATYGYAKIAGEIRRHLRDKCWAIRMPRLTHELHFAVNALKRDLPDGSGPATSEIAHRLSVSEQAVRSAEVAAWACRPLSLDATVHAGGKPATLLDTVGSVDHSEERAQAHSDIVAACATLSSHERSVVRLRFFEELTQSAIGVILGKSQMYVSRLEKRAMGKLRGHARLRRLEPSPSLAAI